MDLPTSHPGTNLPGQVCNLQISYHPTPKLHPNHAQKAPSQPYAIIGPTQKMRRRSGCGCSTLPPVPDLPRLPCSVPLPCSQSSIMCTTNGLRIQYPRFPANELRYTVSITVRCRRQSRTVAIGYAGDWECDEDGRCDGMRRLQNLCSCKRSS